MQDEFLKSKNILSRKQQNSGNTAEELWAMSCPGSNSSKQLSSFPKALLASTDAGVENFSLKGQKRWKFEFNTWNWVFMQS